jgi:hypothetical protein
MSTATTPRGPRRATLPTVPAGVDVATQAPPAVASPNGANRFDFPADLVGATAHVSVWVHPGLGNPGRAVAGELLRGGRIETHYSRIADAFRATNRFPINLILAPLSRDHTGWGGGYHYEGVWEIYADVQFARGTKAFKWDFCSAIFATESTELFAFEAKNGWDAGWTHGEALSRFLGATTVPKTLDRYETTPIWFNAGCPDYVTRSLPTLDARGGAEAYDFKAVGCEVCFLYYLLSLGFTPSRIIAAGRAGPAPALEQVYRKLTGKTGGHAAMTAALKARYPAGTKIGPGIANDNLFNR